MALCIKVQGNTVIFMQDSVTYSYKELNSVDKPRGVLVLFNGGIGDPNTIDKETKINEVADSLNIQCLAIRQGEWFISDSIYNRIRAIIKHARQKFSNNLYVGGFSLGGFTTIRLSELAVKKNDSIMIPNAIFVIDPPLDYSDLYSYCQRELNRNCMLNKDSLSSKKEAKWIKSYLEKTLGNPSGSKEKYVRESCFSQGGGNAQYLKDIPVLFFHEINLMWSIKEKCRDLRDENIFIISQMVSHLQSIGNDNAKIISTQNKGQRSNGMKHPHSWSIAEPEKVFEFLLSF